MSLTSFSVKSTTRKALELARINRVNAEFGIAPYVLPVVKKNGGPLLDGSGAVVATGGAPLRLSNLDCGGRLVKKGVRVCLLGLDGLVVKVNRGYCHINFDKLDSRGYPLVARPMCESVRVISK